MAIFNYEDLTIESSISFTQITDIHFLVESNKHSRMSIKGIVKADYFAKVTTSEVNTSFDLKFNNAEQTKIFSGLVEDVTLKMVGGVTRVEVIVVSHTILMDKVKKSRSFQTNAMTYKDLFDEIETDYAGNIDLNVNISTKYSVDSSDVVVDENALIGAPLIQYNETDFEFLIRIASHFKGVVTPDPQNDMISIWIGYPKKTETKTLVKNAYSWGETDTYYEMFLDGGEYNSKNFRYIEIENEEFIEIGTPININGLSTDDEEDTTQYICTSQEFIFNKSEFKFIYKLGGEEQFLTTKKYNSKFKGLSLVGAVEEASNEKLQVQLEIDDTLSEFYDYSYKPDNSNAWYSMPEEDATVSLYFPSHDEQDAFIINCILKDVTGKNENYLEPFYKMSNNKVERKILFGEKKLDLTSGKNNITLDDSNGIHIKSDKGLIISGTEIEIQGKGVTITGKTKVNIVKRSGKSINSSIMLGENADFHASKFKAGLL